MDSIIGKNVSQYRNVIIRSSSVGDECMLGDDAFISNSFIGKRCTIERRGSVCDTEFGDYSNIGFNTVIRKATIGKYCSISWNCSIGGYNHSMNTLTTHSFPKNPKYGFSTNKDFYAQSVQKPVVVGNDVWIGSDVCILRGVTIGDGAIIGAGSVVTKDVPPYAVVVGNPGRIVKYRFNSATIEKLLKWQWWNWNEKVILDKLDWFQQELTEEMVLRIDKWFAETNHDEIS